MTELQTLSIYGMAILAVLFVNVPLMVSQQGLSYLFSPRDNPKQLGSFAGRIDRAMANSMHGMALFAPAVIAIVALELSSDWTLLLCQIFLVSRLAYMAVYIAGIPLVRSLLWTFAVIANFLLYLVILLA